MQIISGVLTQQFSFMSLDSSGDPITGALSGIAAYFIKGSAGTLTSFSVVVVQEVSSGSSPGLRRLALNQGTTITDGLYVEDYTVYVTATGMEPVMQPFNIVRQPVTYAKDDISPRRTWKFTNNSQTKSPTIVVEHSDSEPTVSFDLTNVLNPGSGISGNPTITVDTDGTDPTISNSSRSSDGLKAYFDLTGLADNVDYTFTCEVETTDGDTIVRTGVLHARDEQ